MNWDLLIEILAVFVPLSPVIFGGIYKGYQNHIDKKERLLDADFCKLQKLLCDGAFKKQMQQNHLLRLLYYKNIKYFSGISYEVIDVVINAQSNKERNFNVDFYQINELYKNKLIKINKNGDGFDIDEAVSGKFCNSKNFVRLLWVLLVIYGVVLLAIVDFFAALLGRPFSFIVFGIGIVPMAVFQLYIMNTSYLIDYLNKFKEKRE